MARLLRKSSLDNSAARSRGRRSVVLCLVGVSLLAMTACGDDEPMPQNEPNSPSGSIFGTTAPVENSSVNGGDTPVEENEVPEP